MGDKPLLLFLFVLFLPEDFVAMLLPAHGGYIISARNNVVARKGRLEEIFSKALYADDAAVYSVSYRDFEDIIEVPLQEFVELSGQFQVIPQGRIVLVKKGVHVLYRKHGH